jgi:hypothetical protein
VGASLDNVTTANAYTATNELRRRRIVRVNFQVSNAAIFYQLGQGWPGVRWGPSEVRLQPKDASLDRACTGVRVRSAVAGLPAQVTVEVITEHELPEGDERA